MSSKSQFPPNARKPIRLDQNKSGLGAVLAEIAKKAQENQQEQEVESVEQDLNVLPLPSTQHIGTKDIRWEWEVTPEIKVISELTLGGPLARRYAVEIFNDEENNILYFENSDVPKFLGQAILAAWNHKNVWKEHVGAFLEQAMTTPQPQQVVHPTPTEFFNEKEENNG